MKRRTLLQLAGANLGAMALGSPARAEAGRAAATEPERPAARPLQPAPDVAVIGAGTFGGWTALNLREMGASVTLLDAYGPGNSRATSAGDTRQIRAAYEDREIYTRWVLRAFERWRHYEELWGRPMMLKTGMIRLAPTMVTGFEASHRVLTKYGVASELMDGDEVARRWPVINPEGIGGAHYEPGASVLRARDAIRYVAEFFQKNGGELRIARAEPGRASGRRLENLALSTGETLGAGQFVFACGPWLKKVFPAIFVPRLSTPRRDVFYFGPASGDARFSYPNLPNFSEYANNYYGFADVFSRGFKVCPTGEQTQFDPDVEERLVAPYQIKRARDYLAIRFPGLRDQPIVESRVCQLENTPDSHFIIARHPDWDNVWLAGGGSGHAFKHGPVLGEYIAGRVLGRGGDAELEAAFRLKDEVFSPEPS